MHARYHAIICGICITLSGCIIDYPARRVASRELVLQQQMWGYEVYSGGSKFITSGRRSYWGLESFVACEPTARQHAKRAARHQFGSYATWISGDVAALTASVVAGLVLWKPDSFSGWKPDDDVRRGSAAAIFFGGGAIAAGLNFAAAAFKNHADGNLIDAVNYYNDRVGSLGAGCDGTPYARPELIPPPAVPGLTLPASGTSPVPDITTPVPKKPEQP